MLRVPPALIAFLADCVSVIGTIAMTVPAIMPAMTGGLGNTLLGLAEQSSR